MPLSRIHIDEWKVKPHDLWHNQWLLLTCGDFVTGQYNSMTVGWGSFGTMWSKPFALVVVRPQRYTFEFIENFDSFTLTAFPKEYHRSLEILGKKSGRDGDKIQDAGLTPIPSQQIAAPAFAEANLIVECKKNYWDDLEPGHFLTRSIHAMYPQKDYHRVYFGEILAVFGDHNFR